LQILAPKLIWHVVLEVLGIQPDAVTHMVATALVTGPNALSPD